MIAVLIVAIVFGSIVAIFAIIFGFLLLGKKMKRGGSFSQSEQLNADETRLIQELHQGLSRMAERIEALETILQDREARKAGHKEASEGKEGDK
jgi:phage shock protein B